MPLPAEFDLTDRTAIVASAGGGETPHLAAALAEAGAQVFAVARHPESLEAMRDAVAGVTGGAVYGCAGRWDTPEGVAAIITAFGAAHERVDILVNDTRSFFAKPAAEITLEEWDELHNRNVRATFLLTQAVGQQMLSQQHGRIVNVISNLAERGIHNCSAFSATQSAVLSLTRSLAVEWGRSEIRVNAIGSGWSTRRKTYRWKSNARSCWFATPRCVVWDTLGIWPRCWCSCAPRSATTQLGSRYT